MTINEQVNKQAGSAQSYITVSFMKAMKDRAGIIDAIRRERPYEVIHNSNIEVTDIFTALAYAGKVFIDGWTERDRCPHMTHEDVEKNDAYKQFLKMLDGEGYEVYEANSHGRMFDVCTKVSIKPK